MTYTLDGISLEDPAGRFWLDNQTGVRILPARRAATMAMVGRDGVKTTLNPSFEAGAILLSIVVRGATYEAFNTNLEFLYGVLGQRGRLLQLVHVLSTGNRHVDVQIVSSAEPEALGPRAARVQVVATAPRPFWTDTNMADSTLPMTAATVTGILSAHAGTTATIDNALIRLKGAFSAATLTDPTTGDFLKINMALLATEYLIIDPSAWAARKVTTDTWTGGTDVSASVDSSRGSGPMLTLSPDFSTGAGRLRLSVLATNAATAPTATVRARRSFL